MNARRPLAVMAAATALAAVLVAACSSDSGYEGGGRRLVAPGIDSGTTPPATDSGAGATDTGAVIVGDH